MEVTLEKIELVKDRTGATYSEAKDALDAANGSVVDAIIAIEENINEEFAKNSDNPLFHKVKEMGDKMDVNSVMEKAKELADKGKELAEEYELKEKAGVALNKGKEYAGVAMEKAKSIADEYDLKDKAEVALEKGKEYAGVAMEKAKTFAEEYEVKDKTMKFIDKVGEKAEKINDAREEALGSKIVTTGEVISEEDDK